MEKMPYRETADFREMPVAAPAVVSSDWRQRLPVLTGVHVALRELRASDAPSLFKLLTTEEVARFISPPPTTVEGFEKFIAWTHRQQLAGTYACFAVTLKGYDTAVGIFQIRESQPAFSVAEWGFALGSDFWGTGLFHESAVLVLQFVFQTLGVERLEARAALRNGRGNGALRKVGGVQEGILRKSLKRGAEYLDQAMYSILRDDWCAGRTRTQVARPPVH